MGQDSETQTPTRTMKVVRTRRAGPVFVCGKCLKRAPDGKALRRSLKDAVAERTEALAAAGLASPKKARLVRTGCLGLCPKRAVVLASPATLISGEMLVVHDRDAVPDAMVRLLPGAWR